MPLSLNEMNIEAAVKMGELHNRLKEIGYSGHQLELYLVRLMFCLFADDTGIFETPNLFNRYILERTNEGGSDLALHIQKIFETLNKSKDKRLKTIDEQLNLSPGSTASYLKSNWRQPVLTVLCVTH